MTTINTKRTIRSDIPGNDGLGPVGISNESRRLVVGHGISLSGEIENCEHLVVEGNLQAEIQNASKVDVLETGFFRGLVQTQDAEIHGRFEGEMTVTGRLSIASTGIVAGTLRYGSLDITPGAMIEGSLIPLPQQPAEQMIPESAPAEMSAEISKVAGALFEDQSRMENNDNRGDHYENNGENETVFRRAVKS